MLWLIYCMYRCSAHVTPIPVHQPLSSENSLSSLLQHKNRWSTVSLLPQKRDSLPLVGSRATCLFGHTVHLLASSCYQTSDPWFWWFLFSKNAVGYLWKITFWTGSESCGIALSSMLGKGCASVLLMFSMEDQVLRTEWSSILVRDRSILVKFIMNRYLSYIKPSHQCTGMRHKPY